MMFDVDLQEFQSTPPVREATDRSVSNEVITPVSIHASREGGDNHARIIPDHLTVFQSTPPVREATRI